MGYTVRSITYHIPMREARGLLENPESFIAKITDSTVRASEESDIEVETTRIVLPGIDPEKIVEGLDELSQTASDYGVLFNIGPLSLELASNRWEQLKELARNRIFFSILLPNDAGWEEARSISRFIHELAEEDPSLATVMGVNVYGRPVITPYYPLASAGDIFGASASLTYPNYLAHAYREGGLEGLIDAAASAGRKALDVLDAAARIAGAQSLGVDLSVAPWMEETSLGLVELVAGVRMPEPGFLRGIRLVNKAIAMAASRLGRTLGFNEVQLPVAEDLKLKKRVAELDTTARDLARFSCVCLAGLDLAVVPASIDGVAGLILDVQSCSLTKDRPLGLRIVPVEDVEPGDKVWLDKFSETPVISI